MAVQSAQELFSEDTVPRYIPGLLALTQNRAELSVAEQAEQLLASSFDDLCQAELGIDINTMSHEFKPRVSHTAHRFIHAATVRYNERQTAASEPEPGFIGPKPLPALSHLVPEAPVTRRIDEYYKAFQTNRRFKSTTLLKLETDFLEKAIKPTKARWMEDVRVIDGKVTGTTHTRALDFQELLFTMKLEVALRKQGATEAADSVEVLLAAYGGWFPENAKRVGQAAMHSQDTAYGSAQAVFAPDDELPDKIMPRKPKPAS